MVGLRTNTLVATGAAIFIMSSLGTAADNLARIASQIVSGVGFLGAGVIMRQGMNISVLNSAATLWCSAAVGLLAVRTGSICQCLRRDAGAAVRQHSAA